MTRETCHYIPGIKAYIRNVVNLRLGLKPVLPRDRNALARDICIDVINALRDYDVYVEDPREDY